MNQRSIETTIDLSCSQVTAFQALITPSAIRHWWSASRAIVDARPGGYWMGAWGESEDEPEYICGYEISNFEPPRMIELSSPRYRAQTADLPFDASAMQVVFDVESTDQGCRLSVRQSGFPGDSSADEFFQGCQKGWQTTLGQLRDWLESESEADAS